MRSVVVALVVAAADAVMLFAGAGGPHPWAVVQVAAVAVVAVSAERWPATALSAALVLALSGEGNALLMLTGYRAGQRVVSRTGAAVAVGTAAACLGGQLFLSVAPGLVGRYVIFVALPAVLGRFLVQRRSLRAARDAHQRQLRREQALVADQERLHERLRIARDVHDSLGHRLSLLSIQAAALEVARLPPPQREAVLALAGTARRALDELHELVGTLRESGEPQTRSLDGIDDLVEEFRTAGTPVTVLREGTTFALGPVAEHAAYRVVEEGLTNAAKHAPGQPVAVSLQGEGDAFLVSVRNPLPEGHRPGRAGHGLAGLDERVGLAGGAFHTTSSEGEFRLVAMLPTTETAEETAEPVPSAGEDRLWIAALVLTAAAIMVVAGPAGTPGG
ncbi:sensor histidine kinase [Actinocorallia populi]|uniref:sensor histidine kinase n=1 Tax=Actinocorallia populi TaxID=2079200 RepID=UPI000D090B16|nr:histidine kinase [Actinocorallia populi]